MRKNLVRNRLALVVCLTVSALVGVVAYAAPIPEILGVGTIAHSELVGGTATATARKLTIPAGDPVGGWHYHPGILLSVVKEGAVTIEDGCGGEETFAEGQGFEQIGGRVHRAKNLSGEDVVEYNMFVMPQGNPTTVNIPGNVRLCGPARSVEECKEDGWMNFTHPRSFSNQGDCVQFVLNGGQ